MTWSILTPDEMFETVTRIRYSAGAYANGVWTDGSETESDITASVQPVSGDDLLRMPEGLRTRDVVAIYTADSLRTANETDGIAADHVVHQDEEYEITSVERWTLPMLPHYRAIGVRVDRTGHHVSPP